MCHTASWQVQSVLCVLPLRALRALQQAARGAMTASHLYDALRLSIWLVAGALLSHVQAGRIYFWMKDITPEFLKIHALYYALEVLQKVHAASLSLLSCVSTFGSLTGSISRGEGGIGGGARHGMLKDTV